MQLAKIFVFLVVGILQIHVSVAWSANVQTRAHEKILSTWAPTSPSRPTHSVPFRKYVPFLKAEQWRHLGTLPKIIATTSTTSSRGRNLVLMAGSRDDDTAMSAYEQAMRQMTAARAPPSQSPPPPVSSGSGDIDSFSTARATTPATFPSMDNAQNPTSTSTSTSTSQTKTAMNAYELYFQNYANNNPVAQSPPASSSSSSSSSSPFFPPQPPPPPPQGIKNTEATSPVTPTSDFVASSFNDPAYIAQEKNNLEKASTWTSSWIQPFPPSSTPAPTKQQGTTTTTTTTAVLPSQPQASSETMKTTMASPPTRQQVSQTMTTPPPPPSSSSSLSTLPSASSQKEASSDTITSTTVSPYASFMEALAPNSAKKTPPQKTSNPPISSGPAVLKKPPMTFDPVSKGQASPPAETTQASPSLGVKQSPLSQTTTPFPLQQPPPSPQQQLPQKQQQQPPQQQQLQQPLPPPPQTSQTTMTSLPTQQQVSQTTTSSSSSSSSSSSTLPSTSSQQQARSETTTTTTTVSSYASFMEALAPNSEKKKPPQKTTTPPLSTGPVVPEKWKPPLAFAPISKDQANTTAETTVTSPPLGMPQSPSSQTTMPFPLQQPPTPILPPTRQQLQQPFPLQQPPPPPPSQQQLQQPFPMQPPPPPPPSPPTQEPLQQQQEKLQQPTPPPPTQQQLQQQQQQQQQKEEAEGELQQLLTQQPTPPVQQMQPPPPSPQVRPQQSKTQATMPTSEEPQLELVPYIPSFKKKDDYIAKTVAKDSATGQEVPLSSTESFLNSQWEDENAETKRFPKAPEFVVKPGVTRRIFEAIHKDKSNPRIWSPWDAFQNAEDRWEDLKNAKPFRYDFKLFKPIQNEAGPPLQFVSDDCAMGNAKCCAKLREVCQSSPDVECTDLDYEGPPLDDSGQPLMEFDVIILGGTLGIFYAVALQLKGLNVCVAAPRDLKGQDQEWNVSMEDLVELQSLGILTQEDIDAAITTVYGGTRAGFKNREVTPLRGGLYDNRGVGYECYIDGILNLGVSPAILIDRVAHRFREFGGTIRERCPLRGVAVSAQVGCAVDLGSYDPKEDVEPITSKLVLDCMGYGSPVARQQRYGVKPDSITMVFGSSAAGYNPDRNCFADIMYTFNPLQDCGDSGKHQYFWESFPVGTNLTDPIAPSKPSFNVFSQGKSRETPKNEGPQITSDTKTTFMFTYIDANKERPSLEEFMEDYWKLLPTYQSSINDPETQLDIQRVVYDYFPAYRDSPMKTQYSRVLSVGESSGFQSPVSFGGFRSLSRNMGRITGAVVEAVETGCLHKDELGEINAYQPNLSAAWLFRDLMSVPIGKGGVGPKFVNRVLAIYLKAMYDLGPNTVTPFMQDVLCYDALVSTILSGVFADPFLMGEMVKHVGMPKILDFLGHVGNMGVYGFLDKSVSPVVRRTILKNLKDPRTTFQWHRRLEAWKYGSGNDYRERKRKNAMEEPGS